MLQTPQCLQDLPCQQQMLLSKVQVKGLESTTGTHWDQACVLTTMSLKRTASVKTYSPEAGEQICVLGVLQCGDHFEEAVAARGVREAGKLLGQAGCCCQPAVGQLQTCSRICRGRQHASDLGCQLLCQAQLPACHPVAGHGCVCRHVHLVPAQLLAVHL